MELPPNVRQKKGLWKILPFMKNTAQAIYPNIYFTKDVYSNLQLDEPNPRYIAVLKHEQTHMERQKKMGLLRWGLKYFFSPKFRLEEELKAIRTSMKYFKKERIGFDTKKMASLLSGGLYLWCIPYKKVKKALDRAWKEA